MHVLVLQGALKSCRIKLAQRFALPLPSH